MAPSGESNLRIGPPAALFALASPLGLRARCCRRAKMLKIGRRGQHEQQSLRERHRRKGGDGRQWPVLRLRARKEVGRLHQPPRRFAWFDREYEARKRRMGVVRMGTIALGRSVRPTARLMLAFAD
eukprot:1515612-Pyramimonas_sp.AAC.1